MKMDDLKTLAEIWENADRKPVKVIDDTGNIWWLVGIFEYKALIRSLDTESLHTASVDCCDRAWKLHKEKKFIEHWPAVYRNRSKYFLSGSLYRHVEDAKKSLAPEVIRLATELPPIMLEVDE